jgi:hypothetical protein
VATWGDVRQIAASPEADVTTPDVDRCPPVRVLLDATDVEELTETVNDVRLRRARRRVVTADLADPEAERGR